MASSPNTLLVYWNPFTPDRVAIASCKGDSRLPGLGRIWALAEGGERLTSSSRNRPVRSCSIELTTVPGVGLRWSTK